MTFHTSIYGNDNSDILLLQMVDEHELETIEQEISFIKELSPEKEFCLLAVKVNDWNRDLSPWASPAVFGKEDFAGKAEETLQVLLEEILPAITEKDSSRRKIIIGGYSLAGLFSLWSAYQTDYFDGIAAASPSIWYPHFTEYMISNAIHSKRVYLSLGDREERTRNPVMSRVGDAIREGEQILKNAGVDCTLEWNKGNHFKNADLRTARAFAWVMERM